MAVGLNQCAEFDITGSSSWQAFDQVTGGHLTIDGGEVAQSVGLGGLALVHRGMVTPTGSATTTLQTGTLLSYIKPSAIGELPPKISSIRGGLVGTTNGAMVQTDCYLRSLKLSCETGGVVDAAYEWIAQSAEYTTITSPAPKQTGLPFVWHKATVELGGAGYKCTSWEVTITNALAARTSLDEKTAGKQRLPEWIDPGNFEITASFRFALPLDINLLSDCPETIGFVATVQNCEQTPKTLTVDLTGGSKLYINSQPIEFVAAANEVIWSVTAVSKMNDLSVLTLSLE